ncbi:MAG: SDR family oxidoreductase, partial [Fimbriimonadaceae bacterium]|nr:SDR family oxidoreductase [Fimbriimonadaceae bacterium]
PGRRHRQDPRHRLTTVNILVTGSSRGIGRAVALRLAASGHRIVLHGSRPSQALDRTQAELGGSLLGAVTEDLDGTAAAQRLWAAASAIAPLDGLVNNAGIYRPHAFAETGDDDFDSLLNGIFGTNLMAPLMLTRLAGRDFLAQGSGRIVQVASRVGLKGEAGAALYAASKAGLINLVKSLSTEHAARGVRHFAIAPGWVDTAMSRDGMEERLAEALAGIPAGRMATPEDCANAVNWLMSGEADYMSGLIIDINGASYHR